ncbi:MAG TPA: hypothetical protein VFA60_01715 [Terriglobales bacterium]|nr:hypothetical protein [Terriglobales bacterium]
MANVLTPPVTGHAIDSQVRDAPRASWLFWVPLSKAKIVLLSVAFATLVFAVGLGLDLLLIEQHEPRSLTLEISDAFTGMVAGALFLRLLIYGQRRRRELERRLEMIAEMNHHIRNALQVIAFSRHLPPEKEPLAAIDASVKRIQWALKELLPKV